MYINVTTLRPKLQAIQPPNTCVANAAEGTKAGDEDKDGEGEAQTQIKMEIDAKFCSRDL